MALDQANVPNILEADVEIDVSGNADFAVSTDLKPDIVGFDPSGGDHNWDAFMPWDGTTLVGVGGKNADQWAVTLIYTDGESPDAWEDIIAAKGNNNIAIRVTPKGETSGNRRHVNTGVLVDVAQPNPQGNAGFQYTILIAGNATYEAVPV